MADADLKHALSDAREVDLTVTGRKSGNQSTRPVWFTQEDGTVYLLPVGGSGASWFKNVIRAPRIKLATGRAEAETEARAITDAGKVSEILDQFGNKYGASRVKQYYPNQDVAVEVSL